jgi:hypothetical protein
VIATGTTDAKQVPLEHRLEFAEHAFALALAQLSPSSPFRPALEQYAREFVPEVLRSNERPGPPTLKLVP